jgi:isopentenyl-diphosphate delta-isomerase
MKEMRQDSLSVDVTNKDSRKELLILVDDNDNEKGLDTKENCHKGNGLRHRAFGILLFEGERLLLQKRSSKKLLWPGYWDLSIASHVHYGETRYSKTLSLVNNKPFCAIS